MSVGDFTSKEHQPTREEIAAALGSKQVLWDAIPAWFHGRPGVKIDLRFYGRNYGWSLRMRVGGKALVSLYPGYDRLTAQVVLPLDLTDAALALDLGCGVRDAIAAANPFAEGRWLFFPLDSEGSLEDLRRLLELKLGRTLAPRG